MPSVGGAVSGGLTGAKLGSFIPGVGNLIGGGIGALLGGLFGGGGDDDQAKQDAEGQLTDIFPMLRESSTNLRQRAGGLADQADSAIAPVLRELRSMLSANPADVMDATRAERGRVIDQYDTARRAVAQFAPRGGGTTSVMAQSQFDQAESLADITSGAQRDATKSLASLGTSLAGLGLSAEQLASQDLNSIINALLAQQGIDATKRGQTMEMWGGIGQAAGSILGDVLLGGD